MRATPPSEGLYRISERYHATSRMNKGAPGENDDATRRAGSVIKNSREAASIKDRGVVASLNADIALGRPGNAEKGARKQHGKLASSR